MKQRKLGQTNVKDMALSEAIKRKKVSLNIQYQRDLRIFYEVELAGTGKIFSVSTQEIRAYQLSIKSVLKTLKRISLTAKRLQDPDFPEMARVLHNWTAISNNTHNTRLMIRHKNKVSKSKIEPLIKYLLSTPRFQKEASTSLFNLIEEQIATVLTKKLNPHQRNLLAKKLDTYLRNKRKI